MECSWIVFQSEILVNQMSEELAKRVNRERLHGASEIASRQAWQGWCSPAGEIRRERRFRFMTKDLAPSAKVLEVGAGIGTQTEKLSQHFERLIGIDVSPELLEMAKARAPRAELLEMDAHRLTFPDGYFDAVVGVSILHHLDCSVALREWHRVLRPGGLLRLSEPNLVNPQIFLQKNIPFLKRLSGDSPDEYAFTRWQIARELAACHYSEIEVEPVEFMHPNTPRSLIPSVDALERFLSRTFLREIAGSLLISARKM